MAGERSIANAIAKILTDVNNPTQNVIKPSSDDMNLAINKMKSKDSKSAGSIKLVSTTDL